MSQEIRVVAGILRVGGEVLCARRASGKSMAGFWEFPGGKIEGSESPFEALRRELQEELDLMVHQADYFSSSVTILGETTIFIDFFVIDLPSKFNVESTDHDSTIWLPLANLAELDWTPADVDAVNLLAVQNS